MYLYAHSLAAIYSFIHCHCMFIISCFLVFRKLYWTTVGFSARIESSNLDGSNRTILVQSKVIWPIDLTIDYANRRLYWADLKKQTIETTLLDGSDRHTVWMFAAGKFSSLYASLFRYFLLSFSFIHSGYFHSVS